MHTVVCEKGLLTIPQVLLDRMNIRPADELHVIDEGDRIVLSKSANDDHVSAVYGTIDTGRSIDEIIEELRGPGPD